MIGWYKTIRLHFFGEQNLHNIIKICTPTKFKRCTNVNLHPAITTRHPHPPHQPCLSLLRCDMTFLSFWSHIWFLHIRSNIHVSLIISTPTTSLNNCSTVVEAFTWNSNSLSIVSTRIRHDFFVVVVVEFFERRVRMKKIKLAHRQN